MAPIGPLPDDVAAALAAVEEDLRRTGSVTLQVDADPTPAGEPGGFHLVSGDGSRTGVVPWVDAGPGRLLASVADQVQEFVIEELWGAGRSAVWPECPRHPGTHPLAAECAHDGEAVWQCPLGAGTIAPVGHLRRASPRGAT